MRGQTPVVEYRCDRDGDACLLLRVFAAPSGPVVTMPPQRLSPDAGAREGRAADELRPGWTQHPLDTFDRTGIVGPVPCRHHVLTVTSAALRQDYADGVRTRRTIRRFLRP